MFEILQGDVLEVLRTLPDGVARCCVTSPAYWGLRDYGVEGQLGLEATPEEYVQKLVEVFREVRRVLADDGTLWCNLGDSYNAYNGGAGPGSKLSKTQTEQRPQLETGFGLQCKTLKPKDLVGIPWRVAFALQADGWYLRSDIIWAKPNPMPESVTDRPTKAHEYLFLLAKSQRYYYDAEAIAQPAITAGGRAGYAGYVARAGAMGRAPSGNEKAGSVAVNADNRNRRSVWTVATQPFPGAHFAVMPEALVEPCILAGSAPGDTVLDPFAGSGTVGVVGLRHGRKPRLIELKPEYCEMARRRIAGPLFADAQPLTKEMGEEQAGGSDRL